MGGLCALRNDIKSGRLQTFLKLKKEFKHTSYQNVWRHLAENFLGKPLLFLHPLHGHRRGLESCESGILK